MAKKCKKSELTWHFYDFEVEASDCKGLLAKGTHSRASVKSEKFQQKANSKYEV